MFYLSNGVYDLANKYCLEFITVNNNILEILIRMNINQPNDILTIRNTADEILTHIKAIQSALEL